eukprot:gene1648-1832_t
MQYELYLALLLQITGVAQCFHVHQHGGNTDGRTRKLSKRSCKRRIAYYVVDDELLGLILLSEEELSPKAKRSKHPGKLHTRQPADEAANKKLGLPGKNKGKRAAQQKQPIKEANEKLDKSKA